jgi:hypothetical protein
MPVTAQAKFTVSVYANSSVQTPGLLGSPLAGGTPGALGYYPNITDPSQALVGPGGLPTTASPLHGLGHMTNIQIPSVIFPNSNFRIVTVFTYSGADVAAYSTRITIPGLGIMNNMSQSASVTGGGAGTVQNEMATPNVLPYGPVTGTVELIRNGGTLTVDDVQPITVNSPGGLGGPPGPLPPPPTGNQPGGSGTPPGTGGQCVQTQACMVDAVWDPVACKCVPKPTSGSGPSTPPTPVPPPTTTPPPPTTTPPPPPAGPPQTVPPVPTPPGPPIPGTIQVSVTRSSNASRITLNVNASGFTPGERVLIVMFIDRPGWSWRRWNRHNFAANKSVVHASSTDGQVMHSFQTNMHNLQAGSLSGNVRIYGLGSNHRVEKDFEV